MLPFSRISRVSLVGMAESEHKVGVTHVQFPHGKVAEAEQHSGLWKLCQVPLLHLVIRLVGRGENGAATLEIEALQR